MGKLEPKQRKILELRYGLEDGNSRTLKQVAKVFNLSRERVRQIEEKAIRKLKHPSRREKLLSHRF